VKHQLKLTARAPVQSPGLEVNAHPRLNPSDIHAKHTFSSLKSYFQSPGPSPRTKPAIGPDLKSVPLNPHPAARRYLRLNFRSPYIYEISNPCRLYEPPTHYLSTIRLRRCLRSHHKSLTPSSAKCPSSFCTSKRRAPDRAKEMLIMA